MLKKKSLAREVLTYLTPHTLPILRNSPREPKTLFYPSNLSEDSPQLSHLCLQRVSLSPVLHVSECWRFCSGPARKMQKTSCVCAVLNLVGVDGFLQFKLLSVRLTNARESAVLKHQINSTCLILNCPREDLSMILFRQKREFVHPILEVSLSFPYTSSGSLPWNCGQTEAIIDYGHK